MGKKFSQWKQGFISCLSTAVHSHGINTGEVELWRLIGSPTRADTLAGGMGEYDAEAMEKLEEWDKL
jgi:hypothetical protein